MQTKKFLKKQPKIKEICIKCKTMELKKTGEGRKFKLCQRCYAVIKNNKDNAAKKMKNNQDLFFMPQPGGSKKSKFKDLTDPRLNENSVYWKKTRFVRLKCKFRYQVFQVYGQRCMCCGAGKDSVQIQLDHILPQSLYPEREFDFSNTQVLCEECNSGKSNKDFTDFRTTEQKELMEKHKALLGTYEDINMVYKLQQNIREYRKLSFMEQATGKKK